MHGAPRLKALLSDCSIWRWFIQSLRNIYYNCIFHCSTIKQSLCFGFLGAPTCSLPFSLPFPSPYPASFLPPCHHLLSYPLASLPSHSHPTPPFLIYLPLSLLARRDARASCWAGATPGGSPSRAASRHCITKKCERRREQQQQRRMLWRGGA